LKLISIYCGIHLTKWLLFVFSFSSHKYIILARINAQVPSRSIAASPVN